MKILISAKDSEQTKQLKEILTEVLGKELESISTEKSYSKALASLPKFKPSIFLFSYEDAKEDIEGKLGYPNSSITFIGFGSSIKSANLIKKAGGFDFYTLPLDKEIIRLSLERWKKLNLSPKNLTVLGIDGNELKLPINKITYIEADNKQCHIYLKDTQKVTVVSTLKNLLNELPSDFLRVHKTFLVRLSLIDELFYEFGGRYMVRLKGGIEIPVGRKFYKSVKIQLI